MNTKTTTGEEREIGITWVDDGELTKSCKLKNIDCQRA